MASTLRYLVLFDVDGTLVWSDGVGRAALTAALLRVYGTQGSLGSYTLHGRTDRQIVYDALAQDGFALDEIDARLDELWRVLTEELMEHIPHHRVRPCDGGPQLIAALQARDDVLVGLVTGNFERTAFLKLEAAGYRGADFQVGAYGSEHADRIELPPLAIERTQALAGRRFEGQSIVVVGDTPADIACARAAGAQAVGVATGIHSLEALQEHAPDGLLPDLSDTTTVMKAILAQPPGG